MPEIFTRESIPFAPIESLRTPVEEHFLQIAIVIHESTDPCERDTL